MSGQERNRRSDAIADYWRSVAQARRPGDLMAVQLNYWTQLVDDYQEAFSEGLAQAADAEQASATSGPDPTARPPEVQRESCCAE